MNCRGQFSLIAALLVAVVLIGTVIITYSVIRNSPVREQAQILSAIDETNFALKQILGFTVGYYGSVLQVTGNTSYAKELSIKYFQSGLVNIANMHPEWGTSFNLSNIDLSTYWYTNDSWSTGKLAINYSLTGLGLYGITYETSCKLAVQVKETTDNHVQLNITKDEKEHLINLGKQNFKFYRYIYENSTWKTVSPINDTSIKSFPDGTYLINMSDPALSGIDPYSYVVQVEDQRGIVVIASSFSRYTCTLNWNNTLYAPLRNATDATMVVELLQNGTMRWLGQNLNLTTQAKPIPPIPVKAIRVNQTINGINQEVPFQIEDWASDYKIPLGLTNNASVFNSRTMLVFLVNPNVSKVTIWWNGSDTATQTPYATTNRYFQDDVSNPFNAVLKNRYLTLNVIVDLYEKIFKVKSTVRTSTSTAELMRINGLIYCDTPPAYVISNGVVRDIVQYEPEWLQSWGTTKVNNTYSQIVLTLPANATYYTYAIRTIFINSVQNRILTDLCPIRLAVSIGQPLTENGTASGYPMVLNVTGLFYNFSASCWQHHWSQLTSASGTKGAGIMFTDETNKMLYYFDKIAGANTGTLNVSSTAIEFLPVSSRAQVTNFVDALDITWYGAVVTFDGTTPIYKQDNSGLWIIAEHPPVITVTTES
ncbi:hypothetical protein DRO59_01135 [Candidatus Bathyarchaeota archaeon]|nr:MAG: hypothetical protein DRO59_01135 [Candidatus Bathyarchaeota archaeon]